MNDVDRAGPAPADRADDVDRAGPALADRAGRYVLHPQVELVAVEGSRCVARGPMGPLVIDGVGPAELRAALEGAEAGDARIDELRAALIESGLLVEARACESEGVRGAGRATAPLAVVGNGPWGRRVAARLRDFGWHNTQLVEVRVDEPSTGVVRGTPAPPQPDADAEPLTASLLDGLFSHNDLVVCALESTPWSSLLEVNRAALTSTRGAALFTALEPGAIVVGPVTLGGAPPCFACSRLGPDPGDEPFAAALPAFTSYPLDALDAPALVDDALGAVARAAGDTLDRPPRPALAFESLLFGGGPPERRALRPSPTCPWCRAAGISPATSLAPDALAWPEGPLAADAVPAASARVASYDEIALLVDPLRELAARRVDTLPHALTTFRDHLLGTWRVLSAWEQPGDLRRAGLFHSCYGSDAFDTATFFAWERATLAGLIGPAAEAIVFLFSTTDRHALRTRFDRLAALPSAGIELTNWRTGQRRTAPTWVVAELMMIEAANEAEQQCDADASPGPWVARTAHWASLLATTHLPAIAAFRGGPRLTPEREREAIEAYRSAGDATDAGAALTLLREAAAANPFVGEPLVVAAGHALARGDASARDLAREGLRRLTLLGVAWDKRTTWETWVATAGRLAWADVGAR